MPVELGWPLVFAGDTVDSSAIEHRTLERTQVILRFGGQRDGKGMSGQMKEYRELLNDGVEWRRVWVGDTEGRSVRVAMAMAGIQWREIADPLRYLQAEMSKR